MLFIGIFAKIWRWYKEDQLLRSLDIPTNFAILCSLRKDAYTYILLMVLLYSDYDIQTVNLTMSPLSCACTVFEFSISRGLQKVLNETETGGFSKVLGFQYIL